MKRREQALYNPPNESLTGDASHVWRHVPRVTLCSGCKPKDSEGTKADPYSIKRKVSTVTWQARKGTALLSVGTREKLFGHMWPWWWDLRLLELAIRQGSQQAK